MEKIVETFLRTHGPCLTTDVSAHLVQTLGLSSAAARKRTSRARGEIKRLAYLTFPHRARFIYLKENFGSPLFWSRLVSALQDSNSAYGLALAALKARNGVVPTAHFPIVSGSPKRLSKHLSYERVLENLCRANLVQNTRLAGIGECLTLVEPPGHYEFFQSIVRSRLIAESILLAAVKRWIQNLALGSYNKVAIRDENIAPIVGPFSWDLTAPSYQSFMIKKKKDGTVNPGFVVCDVLLGGSVSVHALRPFLVKCRTIRSLMNIAPCMQMFVADNYSPDAFELAKRQGIIPATTRNLFGAEIGESLGELISVLSAAAEVSVDPEQFDKLFSKLGKIEGTSIQLRGTLFEFIAADLARKTISPSVRMNQVFRAPDGKETEADIVAVKENQSVYFVECKGYNPSATISDEFVLRWLHHIIPTLYAVARRHSDWGNLAIHFEMWITGKISWNARQAIESVQSSVKGTRYTLALRTGADIIEMCEKAHDPGLGKVFRKHLNDGAVEAAMAMLSPVAGLRP